MNFNFVTITPTINTILNDFDRDRPHDPIDFRHKLMLIFLCTGAIVFILLIVVGIVEYFNQLEFDMGGFMSIGTG